MSAEMLEKIGYGIVLIGFFIALIGFFIFFLGRLLEGW